VSSSVARETEALMLFSKLGRWTEVAKSMSVSIGTVKSRRESAMRKLGARSSVELLTLAIRRGLVDVNSPTQEGTNE
jgi:DNA-binding CsgD family transcriptional regulator